MSQRYASVMGRIVRIENARMSVFDRGLLYGDGLFETIRVRNGKCVRLDCHVERLRCGLRVLGIVDPFPDGGLEEAIEELLEANRQANARVRVTITRGAGRPGNIGASEGNPTLVITSDPLSDSPPEPAAVVLATIRRDEHSLLSSVKSLNYLPSVVARIEAERAGADDALLLNIAGNLSDGTTGNIFLVRGDKLLTPALCEGPLPGTVRAALIKMGPGLGFQVAETAIDPLDLAEADEAFYTNAIQLVRPIRSVSGARIGGSHYPVSARMREALLACEP